MAENFTEKVKQAIRRIPRGKVATYGQIAAVAGNPRAARQVAWVLHSCTEKDRLPWHRVIGSRGKISLPRFGGYELQKALLEKEGVVFGPDDAVDLGRHLWSPQPAGRRR